MPDNLQHQCGLGGALESDPCGRGRQLRAVLHHQHPSFFAQRDTDEDLCGHNSGGGDCDSRDASNSDSNLNLYGG